MQLRQSITLDQTVNHQAVVREAFRRNFRRRERVECKADFAAMAGAVQTGTRAPRSEIQRCNRRAQQAKNGGYTLI